MDQNDMAKLLIESSKLRYDFSKGRDMSFIKDLIKFEEEDDNNCDYITPDFKLFQMIKKKSFIEIRECQKKNQYTIKFGFDYNIMIKTKNGYILSKDDIPHYINGSIINKDQLFDLVLWFLQDDNGNKYPKWVKNDQVMKDIIGFNNYFNLNQVRIELEPFN